MKPLKRAVFLDRDGLLIEDTGYVHSLEDLKVKDGIVSGLKLLQKKFLLFIVTNQSGIGRGLYDLAQYNLFQDALLDIFQREGIHIKKTFFCPHTPAERCGCRKPSPFFLNEAAKEFHIDLKRSYMVGDRQSDIQTGKNAGTKTVMVKNQHHDPTKCIEPPDYETNDFLDAAKWILARE